MKKILKKSSGFFLLLTLGLSVYAKVSTQSLQGHNYPTQIQLEGKTLKLNGIGLRLAKKFFLKFKVYTAALYLEKPSHQASSIINSSEYKKLVLTFLRDVDGQSIAKAYIKGFEDNKVNVKKYASEIKMLSSKVNEVKEDQKIIFEFLQSKTRVNHNGIKYEINSSGFTKEILKLWLGKAPNPEVKSGMLGQ